MRAVVRLGAMVFGETTGAGGRRLYLCIPDSNAHAKVRVIEWFCSRRHLPLTTKHTALLLTRTSMACPCASWLLVNMHVTARGTDR